MLTKMSFETFILGLMNFWISAEVASWEVCRNSDQTRLNSFRGNIYCEHGCCGYAYEQYCCADNIGLIVGCSFGGLVFLGVLSGVIFCCIQKSKRKRSIIRPLGRGLSQNNAAIISSGSHFEPHFKHVLKPPPYSLDPPPAYSEIVPPYSASTSHKNHNEHTTRAIIHNDNPQTGVNILHNNVPLQSQYQPPGAVEFHSEGHGI
ncbi:uncharacterized protein LOC134270876 [Saccostrea cucullata]|uniref:uncharacterized protein LOC134270876 n=1 Tax=Saccostrea cuccullata TaxID=36930 RepID=UPI002ED65AE9